MATATKKESTEPVVVETLRNSLTIQTPVEKPVYEGPYVDIFLPALEDSGSAGLKVDQYEHVTIANEEHETSYKVLRGEHVSVPVPVFMVLKEKYPKL